MERKEYITSLFNKYLSGLHSKQELDELLSCFDLDQDKEALGDLIKLEMEKSSPTEQEQEIVEVIASRIEYNLFGGKRNNSGFRTILPWLSAAAVFVIALGFTFYFYNNPGNKAKNIAHNKTSDIGPGGSRAVLTLSDGSKVDLTAAKNGQLAFQSGVVVNKTSEGQIVYNATSVKDIRNSFNTIETPKGGEFHLVLPDGTEVRLNAASTFRFPTSFTSLKERKVELSGTSITKSKQLDYAVPASKIAKLSSGQFAGILSDVPGQTIELKAFDCEIKADFDAINKEEGQYLEIPIIRQVDQAMIQRNYLQVKQDIQDIANAEMERILNDPALAHMVLKKK